MSETLDRAKELVKLEKQIGKVEAILEELKAKRARVVAVLTGAVVLPRDRFSPE